MFKEADRNHMQWTVGSRDDTVRDTEIKILETLKNKMEKTSKNRTFWYNTQDRRIIEDVKNVTLLNLGMEIGINSISNIIKGKNFSDEFGGLIGLSSEVMSIIRKESPDLLWPEVLKRVDSEMANASSDLGDLGF